MAKKKRHKVVQGFGLNLQALAAGLAKVEAHLRRKEWSKAQEKLQELDRRYPNRPEVLTELVNLYYEINNFKDYQEAVERLVKVDPKNGDAAVALAGSYMKNLRPLLALRAFRYFLDKFPNHPKGAEVRKTVAKIEDKLPEILADLPLEGVKETEQVEIGLLHEETISKLEQGKFKAARESGEKLLERFPTFTPALNNISMAYEYEGERDKAIAIVQRVLEIAPDNFHAQANLARFYLLNGDREAAQQQVERLKAIESDALDVWNKKAEAFAYLEDWQGILDVLAGAEKSGNLNPSESLLLHLAAVAKMNLGEEKEAKKLWQKALKHDPNLMQARENLNDCKHPVGQRHAPWAFDLENWVNQKNIDDLVKIAESGQQRHQKLSNEEIAQRYLKKHPEITRLVPLLLRQGGPKSREFALRFALMAKTPELLEALRDFALSDRGPDSMRMEAAQTASQGGLIPAGQMRMWSQGEWREVLLMGMEINEEPTVIHSQAVDKLGAKAIALLKEKKGTEAEALFKQALAIEPDAPDLLYNLAAAYQVQGRSEEARELTQQIYENHPDYPFARLSLARLHIQDRELEAAEQLLKPMLQWKQFNYSAFCQFCDTQIELCLAQNNPDGARSWLGMWEQIEPDDPQVSVWKKRLNRKSSWLL